MQSRHLSIFQKKAENSIEIGGDKLDFPHGHELCNRTNLARFYSRLLGVKPMLEHIEKDIYKYGDQSQIVAFNNIKWWFGIQLRDVESIREESGGPKELNELFQLQQHHKRLTEVLNDPKHLYEYIVPIGHNKKSQADA